MKGHEFKNGPKCLIADVEFDFTEGILMESSPIPEYLGSLLSFHTTQGYWNFYTPS